MVRVAKRALREFCAVYNVTCSSFLGGDGCIGSWTGKLHHCCSSVMMISEQVSISSVVECFGSKACED